MTAPRWIRDGEVASIIEPNQTATTWTWHGMCGWCGLYQRWLEPIEDKTAADLAAQRFRDRHQHCATTNDDDNTHPQG